MYIREIAWKWNAHKKEWLTIRSIVHRRERVGDFYPCRGAQSGRCSSWENQFRSRPGEATVSSTSLTRDIIFCLEFGDSSASPDVFGRKEKHRCQLKIPKNLLTTLELSRCAMTRVIEKNTYQVSSSLSLIGICLEDGWGFCSDFWEFHIS